jgi:hypothetical protein
MMVFWIVVTLQAYQRFEGKCSLHLQLEDGGSSVLSSVLLHTPVSNTRVVP